MKDGVYIPLTIGLKKFLECGKCSCLIPRNEESVIRHNGWHTLIEQHRHQSESVV